MTFRYNRLKTTKEKVKDFLNKENILFTEHPDFPDAFIVDYNIEDTEIYKNGEIYCQSLSSMKPVYVLDPKPGEDILDMCAAPGSKTTMIQSICNNKCNLTAVELYKDRFEKLKYNCDLQGANVFCKNINALDLLDALKFTKILLDAPCTGTGTDKGDIKVLNKTVEIQKKLIKKAKKLLNHGGILVYSTCSVLKEENEDNVDFAIKQGFKLIESIKIDKDDLFEGFFIAKFLLE